MSTRVYMALVSIALICACAPKADVKPMLRRTLEATREDLPKFSM